MKETNQITKLTKAGNCYDIPIGIDIDKFYSIMYDMIDLAKEKGLTVRQAQYLFRSCEDYVLENKLSWYFRKI